MLSGTDKWKGLVDFQLEPLNPGSDILCYTSLPTTLYDALCKTAQSFPDKTAIVDNYDRSCTYTDLLAKTDAFASYLYQKQNIHRNSHVALMMYNCLEFCVSFLALLKLGAVTIPLPSKYKKQEVSSLVEKADVSCIICDQDFYKWFEDFETQGIRRIACSDIEKGYGLATYHSPETESPVCHDSFDDTIIMFTSGTTSQSKGVVIKNYNIMNAVATYQKILNITADDISVIPIPIYHVTGMVALLGLFIHCGGTLYLHKIFNARRVLQCVKEHNITFLHASPTVFSMLLEEKDLFPSLPTLKQFACGSSNMPKEKLTAIHNWLPHSVFHTVYGLTETTSPATIFPGDASTSPYIGSSGFPVPGTVFEIRDDNGAPLKDGQIGEIWIHGNVVLTSYYKTDTPSLKDGWLGTGDLGYFNEKGYLFVVDRKKDMINRGGEKICSFDVENEIYKLKGVNEAAVVGIPDDVYGEVAAALVKLGPGSDLDEPKIQALLHKKIAKYKIPKRILITDEIPLTPNGKIDKRAIRKMF
jgi:long-chain acyl-CoA synthetase|nr:class I adenylate-forming enzyme family protein [uncultured Blautia sp.]